MKSMAFIDYQNFEISKAEYLKSIREERFNVNFSVLAKNLNDRIDIKPTLMKTYLFAYKPCDDLLKLPAQKNYYNWVSSLKNKAYFEVIEGTQEIRPASKDVDIDINDISTYKTKEKGTDINLAVQMLSKAYQNAYDVAILVSGDTDYIPVIRELHHIGKIVVLASLPNQNIVKYEEYRDAHLRMDVNFLKTCTK
ncbi:MAG: NYN domain-containing protein [Ruminococcaceae bacterium]|nr:NYN domain-containing protein [Oscillospiraceae bacterium]